KQRRKKLGRIAQFLRCNAHPVPGWGVRFAKSLGPFAQAPFAGSERVAGECGRGRIGGGKLEPDAESAQREQQTGEALRSGLALHRRAMEPPLARGAQAQTLEATPLLD